MAGHAYRTTNTCAECEEAKAAREARDRQLTANMWSMCVGFIVALLLCGLGGGLIAVALASSFGVGALVGVLAFLALIGVSR
jgi:predicted lipid-binding transport protein (Tim44 family)